jgi:hypothetical protein
VLPLLLTFAPAYLFFMTYYLSHYTTSQWLLMLAAAAIIGFTKAGIKGMDMLSVTLMALVFGSKASTGVVLPLLCVADVAAVRYYHRHAQWRHFWRLAPWIAAGIGLGVWLGKDLPEQTFRQWMAGIVLVTIILVAYTEWRKTTTVPQHAAFAAATGLATGFTTMLGNLAGAFANLYFLAMRMPRHDFIGTAAWLFLCINAVKLPLQALYWQNITAQSLLTDLALLPALALGFLLGVRLVHRLHDHTYRRVVIVLTLAGALALLLR